MSLGTDVSLYLPVTSLGNGSSRTLPPPPPGAALGLRLSSAQIKQNAEQSLSRLKKKRRKKISVLDTKLFHVWGQRSHARSGCPEHIWHAGPPRPGKGGVNTPCGLCSQVLSPRWGRGSKGLQGPGLSGRFLAQGCVTQSIPSGLDTGVQRFLY